MIQGNKPSNYFTAFDKNGKKIEGEMRMCCHCSVRWQYKPGSGTRRGFCKRCNGLLCGKDECMRYCVPYMNRIEAMEQGKTFNELLKSLDKKYNHKIIHSSEII